MTDKKPDPDERQKRAAARRPTQAEQRWSQGERVRHRQNVVEERLRESTALLVLLLSKSPRFAASMRGVVQRQIVVNKDILEE